MHYKWTQTKRCVYEMLNPKWHASPQVTLSAFQTGFFVTYKNRKCEVISIK